MSAPLAALMTGAIWMSPYVCWRYLRWLFSPLSDG